MLDRQRVAVSSWNLEDSFFGAMLGAWCGTMSDKFWEQRLLGVMLFAMFIAIVMLFLTMEIRRHLCTMAFAICLIVSILMGQALVDQGALESDSQALFFTELLVAWYLAKRARELLARSTRRDVSNQ